MASAFWLCVVIALFCAIWWIVEYGTAKKRRMRRLAKKMPGPVGWPILGNGLIFMTKPEELLNTLMNYMTKCGDYCRFWLGPELLVCVVNPRDIRLLLTSNKINLKGPMYEFMKPFIGPGVLSEGGPIWRSHRKLAAPSYNKKTVQRYEQVFNDNAEELAEIFSKKDQKDTFNVYNDVVKCTTLSVCQCIIGLSKEESRNVKSLDVVVKETHAMYDFLFKNMTRWWLHIPFVYWLFGRKRLEDHFIKITGEMTSDMVARRRAALLKSVPEEPSVVDRFILSGEMSDEDVKFETMTFFTASQEASAKIASMVLLILAHLPDWQDKVYKEIVELLGPEDGFISDNQLKGLEALDMVYKEAIRYMPIGAFIQRTVEEDVSIDNGNITLPTGASVVIPIYVVHRDPRYWEDPYKIDPGRFHPDNARKRDPNAFVPFSLGAMDCIGRVFAESMIKILTVRVLRKVHLEADGRIEDLDLEVAVSVKMAKGYNLRVKPRIDIGN